MLMFLIVILFCDPTIKKSFAKNHVNKQDEKIIFKSNEGKKKSLKKRRGGRGPAKIIADPITRKMQFETVLVYGRIIPREASVIAARTKGAVQKLLVQIGDRVKNGQSLVLLVTEMLSAEKDFKKAELREYRASIKRANAQLAIARQELKRLQKLRKSVAFSMARYNDKLQDVEKHKSAKAEAEAKADQALAQLRMADINLSNAKITAPFDGVVTVLHVAVGNFVNVGADVVTIVNDETLEVEAEVPANRIGGLKKGQIVDVLPEYGSNFKAFVRAVVPEENALSRTRIVRFIPKLGENNKNVASNQSVRLRIPAGPRRVAVTVHKDAITLRRGKKVVFVVNESKMNVTIREVELGATYGSRFEVLKGLKQGEIVAVRGNERLRPNQKVTFRMLKTNLHRETDKHLEKQINFTIPQKISEKDNISREEKREASQP